MKSAYSFYTLFFTHFMLYFFSIMKLHKLVFTLWASQSNYTFSQVEDDQINEVGPNIVITDPNATPTIDHCSDPNSNPCGPNTICHSSPTGPVCPCVPGFVMDGSSSTCTLDVDECITMPDICGDSKTCTNTVGSYACGCRKGYREVGDDVLECRDVDECLEDDTLCGGGDCINTEGGYVCQCKAGFVLNTDTEECEDVNECLDKANDVCKDNSDCVNTVGSFTCQCRIIKEVSCKEGFEREPPAVPCQPNEEADIMPTLGRTKCTSDMDCLTDSLCKVGECR